MTFDLDRWPTDLSVNKDHLLIKDYLPTTFEACGAERPWLINCTRWRLTWPWPLTYWSKYQQGSYTQVCTYQVWTFKTKCSLVISCTRWSRLTWPLTYWPRYQQGPSTQDRLSIYQVWNFCDKSFLSYQLHKVKKTDITFDLDRWPTDLNINRDHLLIKDDLPTKFEACRIECSWL